MCWSLLNPFRCHFLLPAIQPIPNPTSPTYLDLCAAKLQSAAAFLDASVAELLAEFEGGGDGAGGRARKSEDHLLNRCTVKSGTGGSNPSLSASNS